MTVQDLVFRAAASLRRRLVKAVRRRMALRKTSYSRRPYEQSRRLFAAECDWPSASIPKEVLALYLEHRFDLLGSGWVAVFRGAECRGLESYRFAAGQKRFADRAGRWLEPLINPANLEESQRRWQLVDEGYVPIDWQLDFKSGYRWQESAWSGAVRIADRLGADVKVPWELSRLQHLPQMAIFYSKHREEGAGVPAEFRNQVLDFLATNPPGFGVNWNSTMDVAIRGANLVLAFDILSSAGVEFEQEFLDVFQNSMWDHAHHIVGNLERYGSVRANHYLANVAGLNFLAAHLPAARLTKRWADWAVEALIGEVAFQFNDDGSHFEGSTAYHGLCSEMVIFCTALLSGRNVSSRSSRSSRSPLFPGWYVKRVAKMAEFARDVIKPDGSMHQVGDNDSGRFLKVGVTWSRSSVQEVRKRYSTLADYRDLADDEVYWMENHLDLGHVVAAACGILERPDLLESLPRPPLVAGEAEAFRNNMCAARALSRGLAFPLSRSSNSEHPVIGSQTELGGLPASSTRVGLHESVFGGTSIAQSVSLKEGLTWRSYPDFGLYILRSKRLYLGVVCRSPHWRGMTGHLHNDQLSAELSVDGVSLIQDPGSYVYTPLPAARNRYRSVRAHFTPWALESEPSSLDAGLFKLEGCAEGFVRYHGPAGFAGDVSAGASRFSRQITIEDRVIRIADSGGRDSSATVIGPVEFSPGYGLKEAAGS